MIYKETKVKKRPAKRDASGKRRKGDAEETDEEDGDDDNDGADKENDADEAAQGPEPKKARTGTIAGQMKGKAQGGAQKANQPMMQQQTAGGNQDPYGFPDEEMTDAAPPKPRSQKSQPPVPAAGKKIAEAESQSQEESQTVEVDWSKCVFSGCFC
jgi:hypothetical protein